MAASKLDTVKEAIYESIRNDNEGLDDNIKALKEIMKEQKEKIAMFEPEKLVQNNRQGRQMMKSYFKKRGVIVKFSKDDAE